jgi:RNA polymerase sigma factor (sigma-70 family)
MTRGTLRRNRAHRASFLPNMAHTSGVRSVHSDVDTKLPFEEAVTAHGQTVLRVCRAVLGPTDAEDAWAETFVAALEAYTRLPANANVEAWLVTIARRKAIDLLRRTGRHATPVAEIPAQLIEHDDRRDLDLPRSVAKLPDKQRLAVVYHYLIGLPYAEVAAILGGNEAAARRAAADGIAALRKRGGLTP